MDSWPIGIDFELTIIDPLKKKFNFNLNHWIIIYILVHTWANLWIMNVLNSLFVA